MPSANFSINADLSDQGFDAAEGQTLSFKLRSTQGVGRWTLQVFDATLFSEQASIESNPPRQSPGATELELDDGNGNTGQLLTIPLVSGTVTTDLPTGEAPSWIVRSVANNGYAADGTFDPSLVSERIVSIPDGNGNRAIVATERTQYHDDGWVEAFNRLKINGFGPAPEVTLVPSVTDDFTTLGVAGAISQTEVSAAPSNRIVGIGESGLTGSWSGSIVGAGVGTQASGSAKIGQHGVIRIGSGAGSGGAAWLGRSDDPNSPTLRVDLIRRLTVYFGTDMQIGLNERTYLGFVTESAVNHVSARMLLRGNPTQNGGIWQLESRTVALPTLTTTPTGVPVVTGSANRPTVASFVQQRGLGAGGTGLWDIYMNDLTTPVISDYNWDIPGSTKVDPGVGISGFTLNNFFLYPDLYELEPFDLTVAQRIAE